MEVQQIGMRDEDLAVEVTHDAFARVLERWSRLDEPGAYLRTAVVNASRDALRKRIFRRSRRHVIELVDAIQNRQAGFIQWHNFGKICGSRFRRRFW